MVNSQAVQIGARLKAARERAKLTQKEFAALLRFDNRQTLASIEAGERRLSATELVKAIEVLGVDLDYFTDSFRLVGEGQFSFRALTDISPHVLDQFENLAGRWIATYRELGYQQGHSLDLVQLKLALTSRSTFEEAQAAAESISARWDLGRVPAASLQEAIETHLRALILYVDAPAGISGAALHLPGLNSVLVNRREPEGRRNFDLAHELFHLLTWDAMPPEHVEPADVPRRGKGNRVEQLAENFAAALLMPAGEMRRRWRERNEEHDLHAWLNATAEEMRVSAVACMWRLHNLECLSKADMLDINSQFLVANGRSSEALPLVSAFSERFINRIATALDAGRLSVKRAASLLAVSVSELAGLLESYGIEPTFEA